MRIFLDTNVLVSATATRGLCADILREVLALHELVVSSPLFDELERVLSRKFGLSDDLISEVIEFLREDTILSNPGKLFNIRINDQDDVIILSSALNGRAEVFVTGDKEVLRLRKIGGLEILSPREFWERLKA